ncbi:VOC family protein [Streptomyces sp. E11-3]|uniref:VOC family protein n=1 Tax=Streptomyces sp. E11-3 TaxID=3110112 RepID=UPI00398041A7
MATVFGHINIPVRDMDATIAFYRLLGLDVPDAFEWPPGSGAKHVEVPTPGGAYLAFDNHEMARIWNTRFDAERGAGNGAGNAAGNIVVGLLVDARDDVDGTYRAVEAAGHQVGQPPYDAFWGSRYAIVVDPDGNEVGLKSPVDDERRYEPRVGE